MEFSKSIEIPVVFWSFWNLEIENCNISLDVSQKSIAAKSRNQANADFALNYSVFLIEICVTWMELFKIAIFRYTYAHFEIMKIKIRQKALYQEQKSSGTPFAANLGYENPKQFCSL